MVDHITPVIRDKPDHIFFHVGTNCIPSDKDAGDITKSILDLAMSAKSPTCNVSISNIITKKDKHQHKAHKENNHLKGLCTNKKINLIDHIKNIKHQHLNKLKLHLTERCTSILTITFVRETSNIFQWYCVLHSTGGQVTGSSDFTGHKSNSKKLCAEINRLKSVCKTKLNRVIFALLNINSVRKHIWIPCRRYT